MSNENTSVDQGKPPETFEAAVESAVEKLDPANQTSGISSQSDDKAASGLNQTVKVGDEEIPADQLAELVKKGKIAQEWESARPGYNLDSLYADYTKKSQRLAEVERQKNFESPDLPPEDQAILKKAVEPLIESRLQIERDQQALELFKKNHSEYADQKEWGKFASYFNNYYKLPTDLMEQVTVLEMAHQNKNFDAEVRKLARQNKGKTLADAQKLEMASMGGGGKMNESTTTHNYTPEQLKYMERLGVTDYAKQKGLL